MSYLGSEPPALPKSIPSGIYIPLQSCMIKDGLPFSPLIPERHMLVSYHHLSTTRTDKIQNWNEDEIRYNAGNGTILIDRFMHEVAFKLGKLPKYGS